MNDEIKEILLEIESLFEVSEAPEHILEGFAKIKDYITNLQQENERLNEILVWKQNRESELFTIESVLKTNKQLYDERNIYKSRCEKGIQYMKENNFHYMNEYALERFRNDLLNILQNGSDSQ